MYLIHLIVKLIKRLLLNLIIGSYVQWLIIVEVSRPDSKLVLIIES